MDIIIKNVDDLVPYYQNPRIISEQAIEEVAKSIKNHGFRQVVCIDEDNVVIAGHTRLLAAKKLGLTELPCTIYKGTKEEISAYRLADNKVAEYSQWEEDFLQQELIKLQASNIDVAGFNDTDNQNLYDELDDLIEDIELQDTSLQAKDITNQVPLMFYFDVEQRSEIMSILETVREEQNLETKSNALYYLLKK